VVFSGFVQFGRLLAAPVSLVLLVSPTTPRPALGSPVPPAPQLPAPLAPVPSTASPVIADEGTVSPPSMAGVFQLAQDIPGSDLWPNERAVALTFDDGPWDPYTGQLLDILARYRAVATFFVVGEQAARFPDLVRRERAQGNAVANHSWDHPFLTALSADRAADEVDRTSALLTSLTGSAPLCLRPPYGALNGATVALVSSRGLATVLWSTDTSDYRRPGADTIVARVLAGVRPGAIVLMHDGGGDRSQDVAALPAIVEGIRARGYRLVTLCDPLAMVPARSAVTPFGAVASTSGLLFDHHRIAAAARTPSGKGYWLIGADGGVFTFGDAGFFGSLGNQATAQPIAAATTTPSGKGYWLIGADGGVFNFGDLGFFGSLGNQATAAPIVAATATPSGKGYWLIGADGGVFNFGDAGFFGSLGNQATAAPIVAATATPSGKGYWLIGADGGVFTFGDAGFFGSLGNQATAAPIVAATATRSGKGYWLIGADGGVFTFGDARFFGSSAGSASRTVAFLATPAGDGYWLVGENPVTSASAPSASVSAGVGVTG